MRLDINRAKKALREARKIKSFPELLKLQQTQAQIEDIYKQKLILQDKLEKVLHILFYYLIHSGRKRTKG